MQFSKKATLALVAAPLFVGGAVAMAAGPSFHEVHPKSFDPAHTFLVDSDWNQGLGCPTNAGTSSDGSTITGSTTDTACAAGGDSKDKKNQGLILAKTGPTANYAAAGADLKDVKGTALTELGFDIRKTGGLSSPNGSHCGAGAPRFDIATTDGGFYFVGCSSADTPPNSETDGESWIRLRWGGSGSLMAFNRATNAPENISGKTVSSMSIVFDEGSDTGPDMFGLAVLDNIDVNAVLVGQGPHGDN